MTDNELVEKCLPKSVEIYGIFNECIPFIGAKDRRNEATGKLCDLFEAQLIKAIPIIRKAVEEEWRQILRDSLSMKELAVAEEIKRELENISTVDGEGLSAIRRLLEYKWQSCWERWIK